MVFAAHEYTLANLRFALEADPENADVRKALEECQQARDLDRPTLPSTLGREKRINPFLRCDDHNVRQAAARQGDTDTSKATFATLRAWKTTSEHSPMGTCPEALPAGDAPLCLRSRGDS
jgi:hydroxyacylglutathione hydrolase